MRLIFAGTPPFAETALARLHAAGHAIELVLTQPDRPAGRGLKLQPSPVKRFAASRGLAIAQPRGLRLDGRHAEDAAAARAMIEAARADAMVVAAYGLILPQWVLDAPRLGCLNIHASLLPRWRGAAPIQRAIEAGDAETGITIMQMDAGLDTGAMLAIERTPIRYHGPEPDSAARLQQRLAEIGARLIVQTLRDAGRGAMRTQPQPAEGATYAAKVDKREAWIDWAQPAWSIVRRIRAFDPAPGAATVFDAQPIKLWAAGVACASGASGAANAAAPGTILAASPEGIEVAAADSAVRLAELQRAGGRRLVAADFLRGFPLRPGQAFDRSFPS